MSIRVENTPNPNAKKFTTDKIIFEGNGSVSVMPGQTSEYDIMNQLMTVEGVDNVFGFQNFITINKLPNADWDELSAKVVTVMEESGY